MNDRVKELNDAFRQNPQSLGKLMYTRSLCMMPNGFAAQALRAVQEFKDFDAGNDPYGEHDFISVEVDGETVYGEIDYYDRTLQYGSPNPADPNVTFRVLTLMRADY